MVELTENYAPLGEVVADMRDNIGALTFQLEEREKILGLLRKDADALAKAAAEISAHNYSEGHEAQVLVSKEKTSRFNLRRFKVFRAKNLPLMVKAATEAAFSALPRRLTIADEAQRARGSLREILEVSSEFPEAERGIAVQRTISNFGAWVRHERDSRGWKLKDLAEKAGTTNAQISLIERGIGKRGSSLDLVTRILGAFGLELVFSAVDRS